MLSSFFIDVIISLSSFLIFTQSNIFSDNSHFGHFTFTILFSIVTSTPSGIVIGFFQILDIILLI